MQQEALSGESRKERVTHPAASSLVYLPDARVVAQREDRRAGYPIRDREMRR